MFRNQNKKWPNPLQNNGSTSLEMVLAYSEVLYYVKFLRPCSTSTMAHILSA
jgi:hypothetical protein